MESEEGSESTLNCPSVNTRHAHFLLARGDWFDIIVRESEKGNHQKRLVYLAIL